MNHRKDAYGSGTGALHTVREIWMLPALPQPLPPLLVALKDKDDAARRGWTAEGWEEGGVEILFRESCWSESASYWDDTQPNQNGGKRSWNDI